MKTVPTLCVVSKSDAPAGLDELGVDDLPAEVRLALTEIASAARDGLLAMSVAAGMAVMQAMLEAEVSVACGPKGQHDPERGRGASRQRGRLGGAGRVAGTGRLLRSQDAQYGFALLYERSRLGRSAEAWMLRQEYAGR
jgi:hypothetical protein